MRWLSRGPRSRFPADMPRRLETLGRFEFDPQGSGIDANEVWGPCVGPFYDYARTDRAAFLADLRAVVAADDGWVLFGASRLVWELVGGPEALADPAAWPLIDAGIHFKRSRGLPTASLTGYEMRRLTSRPR